MVTCYPIPGKRKALLLCEAFAAGVCAAGGTAHVCTEPPRELAPGAAVFYGVRPAVAHLWQQAQREGRDWFYIDNSYFDVVRERQFRVTKNALQVSGMELLSVGERDAQGGIWFERRFEQLGLRVAAWRQEGEHIVVCAQSDEYMRVVAGWRGNWTDQVVGELLKLTKRRIVVRCKGERSLLAHDLANAWALVTHSSAAAVEAAIAGVPVFVTGVCAATPMSMNCGSTAWFKRLEERPNGFDARRAWAEGLARSQWALDEIRRGDAWRSLNGSS